MTYQVSRNGQLYGPYTLEDLQRYLASGNVLPTDLAKSEEMPDWVPVSQILGVGAAPAAEFSSPAYAAPATGFSSPGYADPTYTPVGAPAGAIAGSAYPDAPNLHWGLVLLFTVLTCGVFMLIWNLVVTAWLKKVQPNSIALFLYIGAAVMYVIVLGSGGFNHATVIHGSVSSSGNPVGGLAFLIYWVVKLVARFMERSSLEEHFNTAEPMNLQLNPVMTFFFGGLYFQSQLNRINAMKQAARMGMGRGY